MKRQCVYICSLILLVSGSALADVIGKVDINFKLLGPDDKIIVEAYDDPEVPGVTCYVSRSKTGGFKGAVGLAEDAEEASLDCKQTGPINLPEDIKSGKSDGDKMIKKRTAILFKTMQVVRFYDKKRNVLVYLVYSDKVLAGYHKNSVSIVPVVPWPHG